MDVKREDSSEIALTRACKRYLTILKSATDELGAYCNPYINNVTKADQILYKTIMSKASNTLSDMKSLFDGCFGSLTVRSIPFESHNSQSNHQLLEQSSNVDVSNSETDINDFSGYVDNSSSCDSPEPNLINNSQQDIFDNTNKPQKRGRPRKKEKQITQAIIPLKDQSSKPVIDVLTTTNHINVVSEDKITDMKQEQTVTCHSEAIERHAVVEVDMSSALPVQPEAMPLPENDVSNFSDILDKTENNKVISQQNSSYRKPLNCDVCGHLCKTKSTLQSHMRRCHGITKYSRKCQSYIQTLTNDFGKTNTNSLNQYRSDTQNVDEKYVKLSVVKKKRSYRRGSWYCWKCSDVYKNRDLLQYHMTEKHPKKRRLFKCIICTKVFGSKLEHDEHKKLHIYTIPDEQYLGLNWCRLCKKQFPTDKGYIDHKYRYHRDKFTPVANTPNAISERGDINSNVLSASESTPNSKLHSVLNTVEHSSSNSETLTQCANGNSSLDTDGAILRQENETNENKFDSECSQVTSEGKKTTSLICTKCGESVRNMSLMYKHMTVKHSTKFQCDMCKHCFGSRSALEAHKRSHTGERPFQCKLCPSTFFTANVMVQHMKKLHMPETDQVYFKCDQCDAKYRSKCSLNHHKIKKHSAVLPFICVCGKGFPSKALLNRHATQHRDRDIKCEQCPAMFCDLVGLKKHVRLNHSGQTVVCDVCAMTFNHSSKLKCHMKVHSGVKPYACDQCDAKFTWSHLLTQHKRTHTGERPYKCDICDKGFLCSGNLAKHNKVHHSKTH